MNLPSPHDLRYFVEVASSLNLSRAAEKIGVTQPSLTLAIRRLEDIIGVPLLIRTHKGVVLTHAGRSLMLKARNLLQEWDQIRLQAQESHSEIKGRFHLGVHTSVALYSLPEILPKLFNDHRELEIRLSHDLSRNITEGVINMKYDMGIVVNPVKHPDLVVKHLYDDHVTLWTGPGKSPIQDPHSGEAVLICDPDLIQSQDLIKRIKRAGISYARMVQSSSLEVVTALVAAGSGIGIIPGKVAEVSDHLKLTPIKGAPVFRDEICFIYRIEQKDVAAIQEFNMRVVKYFKSS